VEEFLRRFDRNRDGRVTKEEFRGPPEVFRTGDRNRDGGLEKKEIEGLAKNAPGGRGGGGGEREAVLCVGKSALAVICGNTLYAFSLEPLAYRGHNRFGRPAGTHFERRDRRAPPAPPTAAVEGDTVWILAGDEFLRVSLKSLRVKAEADLPALPEGASAGERKILVSKRGLVVSIGDALLRYEKKKLTLQGKVELK
jgi:hypothetical protein